MVCELFKTIEHFFPDLFERLRPLEDCRGKSDYALSEILMAGIALFIFQQGSRNAFARLAAKLKHLYPRLPLCLTADGLYPYQHLYEAMIAFLLYGHLRCSTLEQLTQRRFQIRST